MGEEKKKILQMVADGVITAEDGVKLLEALEKGDQRRRERELRTPRGIRGRIIAEGIGERLAEIGPMVRTAVCEAIIGTGDDGDDDEILVIETDTPEDYSDLEEVMELPADSVLVIKNRGSLSGGGSLELKGTEGSSLKIVEGSAEIAGEDGRYFIRMGKERLSLEIPAAARVVSVNLRGANVSTEKLDAETDIRTKGGNIEFHQQGGRFNAKTMGGNIYIELSGNWDSSSRAGTMGGNVSLVIPGKIPCCVTASTVGGDIAVAEGLGEVRSSRSHAGARIRLQTGEDDEAPRIRLKTMGGSIEITEKS